MADGPRSFFKTLSSLFSKSKEADPTLRHTLEELIEEHGELEPSLDAQEKKLLGSILDLKEQTVYDIMIPRVDIIGAPTDSTDAELKEIFCTKHKSMMPIFRETLDDVVGLLNIYDFLGASRPFKLNDNLKPAYFVAPSMPLLDLLTEMHRDHYEVALVVDEYGGIDGLISKTDVMDHLLGDLESEERPLITPQDAHFIADGRLTIEDLEEKFGDILTDDEREEDLDTLAGLIMTNFDKVPIKGDLINHPSGFTFEVLEADPRKIKSVLIRPPQKKDAHEV
jgi:CBS domain containing-hemolysin-like protein